VGASGAVFGLFGALLVADRIHKPALTRNARNLTGQIGILIGINLFIGFSMPGIDNAAHIGGLLAGAWLGYVLVPRGARLDSFWSRPRAAGGSEPSAPDSGQRSLRLRQVGGVAALIGVIVLALAIGPVTWQPSDYIIGSAQPIPATETLGDAVGVTSGQARMLDAGVGLVLGPLGEGQGHDDSAAGGSVVAAFAQQQAQPGGDAAG
jgi:hypothetical protein